MPTAQEFAADFLQRHPRLKQYMPPKVRDKGQGGGGQHGEAQQHGEEIWLFPKFWGLPADVQDFVFAHEIGHYVLSEYGLLKFSQDAEKAGVDVWDNLPFGQFNKDEAFADAFATYFLSPAELRTRYKEWVPLVEGVVKKTHRTAYTTKVLDVSWVEVMRKDFLTLTKNTDRVGNYHDMGRLNDGIRTYAAKFEKLFFKQFLNQEMQNREWIDKKLRKAGWSFYVALRDFPYRRPEEYWDKARIWDNYVKEAPKWKARVQRVAREFWSEMREVLEWVNSGSPNNPLTAVVPEEYQTEIEGFKVILLGYDEGYESERSLAWAKEGLRHYRERARQVAPFLLRHAIPFYVDFAANLDVGGTYEHQGYIKLYPSNHENPKNFAKVVAHEMGHRIFHVYLSDVAKDTWNKTIRGDYGDLDLAHVLEVWPGTHWAFDMYQHMADPVLGLQIATLTHAPSYSDLQTKEDFQALYDEGVRTLRVPQTPITGYAGKNPEEAFCEALGLLVAYGPRALHERVRWWLQTVLPTEVRVASQSKITSEVLIRSDQGWDRVRMASRVIAKYKSKKKVKTKDGEERTIYEYSDRQIALRNAEKAKQVEKLKTGITKLRSKIKRDLRSDDPDKKLTALAVALIDHTYERVGNDESAEERGHFGVTGWQRGHLSFGKGGVTISYTGKSGVRHKKKVTDDKVKKALRDAYEAVEGEEASLFEWEGGKVTAEKVNAYLEPFDITAKDLRGFHANRLMAEKLRAARKKGGKLPTTKKDRTKALKAEFKKALEETAEEVGHEAATLRSQYLVVGLEDQYTKDGSILDKVAREAQSDLAAQVVTRFLLGV